MIVVTAIPVAKAKARTIITKIVFMTPALIHRQLTMAEPGGPSVTGITEHRFLPDIAAPGAGG
jgi:hypothetical protein